MTNYFRRVRAGNAVAEIRRNMMKKYNITAEDYKMVEIVIIENKPHKAGPQWKFAGAFYFATLVLAMIGELHSRNLRREPMQGLYIIDTDSFSLI